MTHGMGKMCFHLNYVLFRFHSETLILMSLCAQPCTFTLVVPSWIIWMMSHISFAVSQWETHKNSSRPTTIMMMVFSFKLRWNCFIIIGIILFRFDHYNTISLMCRNIWTFLHSLTNTMIYPFNEELHIFCLQIIPFSNKGWKFV